MSPLVLFLVLATTTPAAAAADVILSRAPYRYTAWDSLPRPERSVDRAAFEEARSDSSFSLERITYRSDSLRVAAYLARPAGALSSRQPCVVYVRGSWRVGDIGWQLAPMFRRLVRAGFLVLAPLLRGSDGEAGVDDMGGADLDDLMRALPVAVASGADSSRMFLYGESRGGMMVFQALREGFPARAAVTVGAFTDLDSMIAADTTQMAPVARMVWPNWPTHHDRIAPRRSALRWPDRLRVPLLLLHGTEDRLSPRHSVALAEAVKRAGGVAEVRLFEGAGHTLRGREVARDSMAVAWFRAALARR